MYDKIKYLPAGDKAVVMEFGNEISAEINTKIKNTVKTLEEAKIYGIEELLPTYRSILINYDPLKIQYIDLIRSLDEIKNKTVQNREEEIKVVELPVCYGGEFGPDIDYVAQHNNLTTQEVINIHTGEDYLVYMLGFTPGFAYLGGMSEKIATPRLSSPRLKIPAGSVGIAGTQTGIYPSETPGGWQLIGRTPLKLYNPKKEPPALLNAGDYIRFVSISQQEYQFILSQVEEDKYQVITITKGGDSHE